MAPPRGHQAAGFWSHQYSGEGTAQIDEANLRAYRDVAGAASAVFSEAVPAATIAEAKAALNPRRPSMRDQVTAQALAAWLNFAHGGIGWDEDVYPEETFAQVMAAVEATLLDPEATRAELEHAKTGPRR